MLHMTFLFILTPTMESSGSLHGWSEAMSPCIEVMSTHGSLVFNPLYNEPYYEFEYDITLL